jgi:hypothetical protein
VTHGQVIEALVANRLTSPRPLLRVTDRAREWAVTEVLGIAPDALNDDRIGRALNAVADQLEQVIGSVGARAIATFGIDVARLHWDMTSISLYGAYEDPRLACAAALGQAQGPPPGPQAGPDRPGGQRRRRGAGVASRL